MSIDDVQARREKYFFLSESIRFPPETLSQIIQPTIAKPDSEFWALLLGRDNLVSTVLEIGIPSHDRSVAPHDLEKAIKKAISPFKAKGLKIVADYHGHTTDTVRKYTLAGFLPAAATILSPPDIDNGFQQLFKRVQSGGWPRMVGAPIDHERVAVSAFDIYRPFVTSPSKKAEFEIPDPDLPPMPPPNQFAKMGGRMLRSTISDPVIMINNLWVRPREIEIDGFHKLPVELNAIQGVLSSQIV